MAFGRIGFLGLVALAIVAPACAMNATSTDNTTAAQSSIEVKEKLFYSYPLSTYDRTFEMRTDCSNHPGRASAQIRPMAGPNGSQMAIFTHRDWTYGTSMKEVTFNVETGEIAVASRPGGPINDRWTVAPPANNGNAIAYRDALQEMRHTVQLLAEGRTEGAPYCRVEPMTELNDTLAYLDAVFAQVQNAPSSGLALTTSFMPRARLNGTSKVHVTYEAKDASDILVQYQDTNGTRYSGPRLTVEPGNGERDLEIQLPASAAIASQTGQNRLVALMLPKAADPSQAFFEVSQWISVVADDAISTCYVQYDNDQWSVAPGGAITANFNYGISQARDVIVQVLDKNQNVVASASQSLAPVRGDFADGSAKLSIPANTPVTTNYFDYVLRCTLVATGAGADTPIASSEGSNVQIKN